MCREGGKDVHFKHTNYVHNNAFTIGALYSAVSFINGQSKVPSSTVPAVHNGWARLIVLLLGDPHLLEGGQGSQDGTAVPDFILALWWSDDLDLHGGWGQGRDLLLHPLSNAREHRATSRQDGVGVQVLPDVHVTLHDGVVGGLMDTSRLHTEE